jgi:hypothetical protein
MLKKFTAADRFESGIGNIIKGKNYAFVPIVSEGSFVALAVAITGEPDACPIAIGWCYATSYEEMVAHAVELNRGDGIDDDIATKIIKSVLPEGTGEHSRAFSTCAADSGVVAPELKPLDRGAGIGGGVRQPALSFFRKAWSRVRGEVKDG